MCCCSWRLRHPGPIDVSVSNSAAAALDLTDTYVFWMSLSATLLLLLLASPPPTHHRLAWQQSRLLVLLLLLASPTRTRSGCLCVSSSTAAAIDFTYAPSTCLTEELQFVLLLLVSPTPRPYGCLCRQLCCCCSWLLRHLRTIDLPGNRASSFFCCCY